PQAEGLERWLTGESSQLNRVLYFNVPEQVVIERLGGRRTCRDCGTLYHLVFNPPRQPGICDDCDGELYQRDDDREEVISKRLETYRKQTAPVIEFYRERGLLTEINGAGRVESIRDDVFSTLS
ncbi:MAG: adenylate kinase, partial [Deltaproteobacteria bacterium]|nr:adenylate kinase [Deltaproteobacteria bacterium]